LKRTSDFGHFSDCAKQYIVEAYGLPDVLLMEKLNFTPSNWKVWKSKLIEKFSLCTYTTISEGTDNEIEYKIIYNKKEKMWKINYINN
jgi:hypothetical protein